jgi:CMD domain protein
MSQPHNNPAAPDVIDALAGTTENAALRELRARRPDVARYAQSSYDALFEPASPGDVSARERNLAALRSAVLGRAATTAAHYRERLRRDGVPATTIAGAEQTPVDAAGLTAREAAILRFADLLTLEPREASRAAIEELRAAGLSPRDIVTIAQVISFVSFQLRVVAGLQALGEGA